MEDTAGPSEDSSNPHIILADGVEGLVEETHDHHFATDKAADEGSAAVTPAVPQKSEGGLNNICPVCGNGFRRRRSLVIHKRLHTGERPFQCDQCPKAYTSRVALRFHERKHSNPKPSETDGCPETGDTKEGSGEARPRRKKNIKCEICSKLFKDSTSLKDHMRVHEEVGDKPYACNLCQASFVTAGGLGSHLRNTHKTPSTNDK